MAGDKKSFKKKLTITDQSQLATFSKDGEDTIIYEVKAISETGAVVDQPLRTFESDLPRGELIEFEVVPYDHEKYGRSYTLKSPSKGRASKKDISEMKAQLTNLAGRVGALETDLGEIKASIARGEKLGDAEVPEDDIPF